MEASGQPHFEDGCVMVPITFGCVMMGSKKQAKFWLCKMFFFFLNQGTISTDFFNLRFRRNLGHSPKRNDQEIGYVKIQVFLGIWEADLQKRKNLTLHALALKAGWLAGWQAQGVGPDCDSLRPP